MPTVGELAQAFRPITSLAASWDPVGLQFGDRDADVASVAVCHEVTDAVVDRLEAERAGLLVAYHPLLFRPTTTLVAGSSPAGRAFRLIRAGVALLVVHTGWDVHPGGTADRLAAAAGLSEVTPFGMQSGPDGHKVVTFVPHEHEAGLIAAIAAAGAGMIGDYSGCSFSSEGTGAFTAPDDAHPFIGTAGERTQVAEHRVEMVVPPGRAESVIRALLAAHPYEEPAYDLIAIEGPARFIGRVGRTSTSVGALAADLAEVLAFDGVRVAGNLAREVSTVAVVPGSGADFIGAAGAVGAEVLVTGDVGHHRAQEALAAGLSVVDVGHIPGERPGLAALVEETRSRVGLSVLDCSDLDPNPWEAT
ncbi:MAG: Nif3-like dinuclear metal center hexameric protein [Acidimicrobiia bacterium]|nr:MAG: Nif3-like dinuclear metal center hexameric protein [Acidimicrobiia bacterium]